MDCRDGVLCGAVSKLVRGESGDNVGLYEPLEALHDDDYRVVVIERMGTSIIVAVFRHDGTIAWFSEMLTMSMRTPASWSAHSLCTHSGMLSGPTAFPVFTLFRVQLCQGSVTSHQGKE